MQHLCYTCLPSVSATFSEPELEYAGEGAIVLALITSCIDTWEIGLSQLLASPLSGTVVKVVLSWTVAIPVHCRVSSLLQSAQPLSATKRGYNVFLALQLPLFVYCKFKFDAAVYVAIRSGQVTHIHTHMHTHTTHTYTHTPHTHAHTHTTHTYTHTTHTHTHAHTHVHIHTHTHTYTRTRGKTFSLLRRQYKNKGNRVIGKKQ